MAPKQEGRLVDDQRRREEAGLSWKSASTLDRQRKRAWDRKGKGKGPAQQGPANGQAKGDQKGKDKGAQQDNPAT